MLGGAKVDQKIAVDGSILVRWGPNHEALSNLVREWGHKELIGRNNVCVGDKAVAVRQPHSQKSRLRARCLADALPRGHPHHISAIDGLQNMTDKVSLRLNLRGAGEDKDIVGVDGCLGQ